jgi:hypothetical protein
MEYAKWLSEFQVDARSLALVILKSSVPCLWPPPGSLAHWLAHLFGLRLSCPLVQVRDRNITPPPPPSHWSTGMLPGQR